jgi:hypothetical protein
LYKYQWLFQGIVQDVSDGRNLTVVVDLGFQIQKITSIGFNRLRIFLPNDSLNYFLGNYLKNEKIYFHSIKGRDRLGGEKFFAEVYVDQGKFPTEKSEPLSLKEINRALATGLRPDL